MKKIAFIIMSLRNGGAERVVANLANEYSRRRDCSFYLITGQSNKEDYALKDEVN